MKRFAAQLWTSETGRPIAAVLLAGFFILAVATLGKSQTKPAAPPAPPAEPQVDTAEIERWGNHAQHIDGAVRDDAEQLAGEALALPPDDNHKWFITVIGTKGCPACARLKADIKADQAKQANLGAFITLADDDDNHSSTKKGWSHYNYLSAEDKSQEPFVKATGAKAFPTIVVQTPLNNKYGPAGRVVFQRSGYDGNGEKLSKDIADSIRRYVAKMQERPVRDGATKATMPPPPRSDLAAIYTAAYAGPIAQREPPFAPPPKVDPTPTPSPLTPFDPLPAPLQIPPPAPAPTPPPTPAADAPATPGSIPQIPEAVVVVDGSQTAEEKRLTDRIVEKLKRDRPGLRTIIKDIRDAKNLNVAKDDLPAVVVTSDGQVRERLGGKLLPLLLGGDGATIEPQVNVAMPEIPWTSIAALLVAGPTLGTIIPLVAWAILAFRTYRKSKGTALNLQPIVDQMLANPAAIAELLARLGIAPRSPTETK